MIYIRLLILSLILSSCSSYSNKPLTQIEYKYLSIPDTLLEPCIPTQPPDALNYVDKTLLSRTTLLSSYVIYLYRDLSYCQQKIDAIKRLQEEYKVLFSNANK